MDKTKPIWSKLVQMGQTGSSLETHLPSESEMSQALKFLFFRAQAEPYSAIQNPFEPNLSQARILSFLPSLAKPAHLK